MSPATLHFSGHPRIGWSSGRNQIQRRDFFIYLERQARQLLARRAIPPLALGGWHAPSSRFLPLSRLVGFPSSFSSHSRAGDSPFRAIYAAYGVLILPFFFFSTACCHESHCFIHALPLCCPVTDLLTPLTFYVVFLLSFGALIFRNTAALDSFPPPPLPAPLAFAFIHAMRSPQGPSSPTRPFFFFFTTLRSPHERLSVFGWTGI